MILLQFINLFESTQLTFITESELLKTNEIQIKLPKHTQILHSETNEPGKKL